MSTKPPEQNPSPAHNVARKGTGGFASSILTLAGGTSIAYGVYLLSTPITSRFFGPKEFGLAALFVSGATILGMISCLRYENALVLPKDEGKAASLLGLCGIILLGMSLLTGVFTAIFGDLVLKWLNATELSPLLWLFPIQVFLFGSELLLRFWNTRHKRFQLVAGGRMLIQVPMAGAEIGGGAAGFRTGSDLVVLRVISLIAAPLFLFWRLLRDDLPLILSNFRVSKIIAQAKRYIKFPLFDSLSTLLNIISWHAPIILLPAFFNPAVGGLYTKAVLLLYVPAILVGESVGQVFLQLSAEQKADGRNLSGLFAMVFNRMISFGTLLFALIAIIGPEIFSVFLGERWAEAGTYAGIICPWMFMFLLLSSIRTLFGTLEKQDIFLFSNVVLFFLRVGILVLGGTILNNEYFTLILFSIISTLVILWLCYYLMKAVHLSLSIPLLHFIRCVAYAAPTIIIVSILKWWFMLDAIYLDLGAVIFSIPYLFFVIRRDDEVKNLIKQKLGICVKDNVL